MIYFCGCGKKGIHFSCNETEGDVFKSKEEPKVPSTSTLLGWEQAGIAEATDGCVVEPDGVCEHGCKSWLLVLGLV